MANARCMRAAQLQARERLFPLGPPDLGPAAVPRPWARAPPVRRRPRARASGHGMPLHSAERAKDVVVHYRWHPLHARLPASIAACRPPTASYCFANCRTEREAPCPRG